MNIIQILFYVLALVLLCLAAFGVSFRTWALGWLGLAMWLVAAVFVPLLT